jgi:DMSO/TMAO reductase YedYZ molybdopterin-dependent catalytic subunit
VEGRPDRRQFMQGAAACSFALGLGRAGEAESQRPRPAEPGPREDIPASGFILREREPQNLEYPFSTLDSAITPTDRFFIRNHFVVPRLDAATWRLRVEGAVERPGEYTLDQLRALPRREVTCVLECSGNNRGHLVPTVPGLQWDRGAVGQAAWTGVSLAEILAAARPLSGAVDVILEGADEGEPRNEPRPAGRLRFARSLTLAKATSPEVVLAYRMNSDPLPRAHGFPLRAVVPGWYAVASIKWLTRIVVTDRPFAGYSQTVDYAIYERRNGVPTRVPITSLQVKAQIARPASHEVVPAGKPYRIHGAAWADDAGLDRVDVSVDGGMTWANASLTATVQRWGWQFWEYDWKAPARPGAVTLMARATDRRGRTQPTERDRDRGTYMINHLLPVHVVVG